METVSESLAFRRAKEALLETWQGKVLTGARFQTAAVIMSVLAHSWPDQMETLLRAAFPGFTTIVPPFLCSAGKIAKTGHVIADVVQRGGIVVPNVALYANETALRDDMRRLADQVKLGDIDRIAFFDAVRRWIVCDYRLDPTMDPRDPDAKRLVH